MQSFAQMLALRYVEADETGSVDALEAMLDPGVVYMGHMGAAYGKQAVMTVLSDSRRFMRNKRSFGLLTQVQHCLEPMDMFPAESSPKSDMFNVSEGTFLGDELAVPPTGTSFDAEGFDAHGFAQFEREGKIAMDTAVGFHYQQVRQTIVVTRAGLVKLICITSK
jgi:hypothetical protein